MHLLLTNDDGYEAEGLTALFRAVGGGHRVTVAAPAGERSTCSHSATLVGPIAVHRVHHPVMGDIFAVDATPADCVRLAVAELAAGPIDCVLSGINHGANVSVVDVAQSGTVAAVREAAFCGISGIAFSQMFRKGDAVDWSRATQWAAALWPQLRAMESPEHCFWNVNFPALVPGASPAGVRMVPLATDPIPLRFDAQGAEEADVRAFTYRGIYESRTITPGTDVAAVFDNFVSVTAIGIDPTDRSGLSGRPSLGPA